LAAPVAETHRRPTPGHRIVKEHKDSTRRIDLAVAAVMAFAAASVMERGPQLFVFDDQAASIWLGAARAAAQVVLRVHEQVGAGELHDRADAVEVACWTGFAQVHELAGELSG
jgi:hypothetical protein